MLRLRNRLLPLLRAASPLPAPIQPHPCCLLSTSPSHAPFSIEDYLIASCGLAPAQAREASKKMSRELLSTGSRRLLDELSYSRLMSASNPDAIIALLTGVGLSRADIAAVVSADPLLRRAYVKKIAPRLLALRDRVGLSTSQIARFLVDASHALRQGNVTPRLEFFISFYGSFEKVLVAAKKCKGLLTVSLARLIKPNIALFRQWGIRDIAHLCSTVPRLVTYSPERLKECLPRAEQLGVPPNWGLFGEKKIQPNLGGTRRFFIKKKMRRVNPSPTGIELRSGCFHTWEATNWAIAQSSLFGKAVEVVSYMSEEKVAAKFEFFKRTLGWSDSEVSTAVSKAPFIIARSDEILLPKIEFLINEAAMEPRYIVERPVLLAYSLEKRLVPRHNVMKVLQEKGLLNSNRDFFTITTLQEEAFKSKFIDCHKDFVPGLADAYVAARAGIVPSRV